MAERNKTSDRAPRGEQDNETAALPDDTQARRATTFAEGGGPWPEELLQQHIAPRGALLAYSPEQNYTSHEDAK